jgi:hypothetical protein
MEPVGVAIFIIFFLLMLAAIIGPKLGHGRSQR